MCACTCQVNVSSWQFGVAYCALLCAVCISGCSFYILSIGCVLSCEFYNKIELKLNSAKRMLECLTNSTQDATAGGVPSSLVAFVSYIGQYGEAFHELYRLGRVAVSLPISTASCERTFSAWLIEQGLMSPPTQYRLYGRRFLQVKRPNQQYQSTEGTHTLHK